MKKLITLAGLLTVSFYGYSQPWQLVGPRAMGMGGAGVAVATGAEAQYWNPAGLAVSNPTDQDLILGAGLQWETTKDVVDSIDGLNHLSKQYKSLSSKIRDGAKPTNEDFTAIFEGLGDISKLAKQGTGVLAGANAGIGAKIKQFAVSVRSLGTAGVIPVADNQNLGFGAHGSVAGLNLSATTTAFAPGSARAQAADMLAGVISQTGTLAALNNLLGKSYSTAADMANALLHTAIEAGVIDDAKLLQMAQAAVDNLPSAAQLINTSATGEGYENNTSRVIADVGAFTEAALGYGHALLPGLQIGGNVKVIEGALSQTGVLVLSDDKNIRDIISDANEHKKRSTNIGVDLGARLSFADLLDSEIWGKPTVGITARNVNGPKFKRPGVPAGLAPALAQSWNTDDYKLKPQVRAGAALEMLKFLTVAADIDVTENDTQVAGYKSRQLAFGAELDLTKGKKWGLPVRVGINKNVAQSDSEMYYTAGLGLRLSHVWLELAGAMSGKTAKVDGENIPASAAASFQLGFVF